MIVSNASQNIIVIFMEDRPGGMTAGSQGSKRGAKTPVESQNIIEA
jgi:hypothetical protein